MKYVTAEDIARYQQQRAGKPLDLAAMVNFFCEGAVTSLGNFLYEHIAAEGRALRHGLPTGCRCSCCRQWQIVEEGGAIVDSADSLSEWALPAHQELHDEAGAPEAPGTFDLEEVIAEQVEALRVRPFHEEAVEDVLAYIRTQPEAQARATVRAYYAYKLRFEVLKCRTERTQRNAHGDPGVQA